MTAAINVSNDTKKRTLNEIIDDYRKVLFEIDGADGELSEDLETALNEVEAALAEKVERCLWVMQEAKKNAELYEERAQALSDRAKRANACAERLKSYVHGAMLSAKIPSMDTQNFHVAVAKTNPSLGIQEGMEEELLNKLTLSNIPDWEYELHCLTPFVRMKFELNKKSMLDAVKSGEKIPFTWLIKDRTHLRVK
jgi:hypothetical protein